VTVGATPFSHTVAVPLILAKGSVVTTTFIVAVVAQVGVAVELGVKVYAELPTDAVEIVAGSQVPEIPLVDVDCKAPEELF
jgi:hypothetical protein